MVTGEKRRNPRLAIRLPIAHRPAGELTAAPKNTFTTNVSPGGVQFITNGDAPEIGSKLEMELIVPPGEGHFPYVGRILGIGTVLRCASANSPSHPRWTVAAKFDDPLSLEF